MKNFAKRLFQKFKWRKFRKKGHHKFEDKRTGKIIYVSKMYPYINGLAPMSLFSGSGFVLVDEEGNLSKDQKKLAAFVLGCKHSDCDYRSDYAKYHAIEQIRDAKLLEKILPTLTAEFLVCACLKGITNQDVLAQYIDSNDASAEIKTTVIHRLTNIERLEKIAFNDKHYHRNDAVKRLVSISSHPVQELFYILLPIFPGIGKSLLLKIKDMQVSEYDSYFITKNADTFHLKDTNSIITDNDGDHGSGGVYLEKNGEFIQYIETYSYRSDPYESRGTCSSEYEYSKYIVDTGNELFFFGLSDIRGSEYLTYQSGKVFISSNRGKNWKEWKWDYRGIVDDNGTVVKNTNELFKEDVVNVKLIPVVKSKYL
jgi:hypothetical protein